MKNSDFFQKQAELGRLETGTHYVRLVCAHCEGFGENPCKLEGENSLCPVCNGGKVIKRKVEITITDIPLVEKPCLEHIS